MLFRIPVAWDGLALVGRGGESFICEPLPGSGVGAFFTGKPQVEELGRVFLYRNYRPDLAKWQTADPLGYPDGWNQLAYGVNSPLEGVDLLGAEWKYISFGIIDAAMKYYDKTQFGRDRTPGDPQRFHNVNSLVWRCGAAGVRALPVLTAHDISLPEQ